MKPSSFIPLAEETRALLATQEAAPHLRMKTDCLRSKSNDPTFPIKPVRIQRHLLWRTADIRKLVAGE